MMTECLGLVGKVFIPCLVLCIVYYDDLTYCLYVGDNKILLKNLSQRHHFHYNNDLVLL